MTLTDAQSALLARISDGTAAAPVTIRELREHLYFCAAINVDEREIKRLVKQLRNAGHPIGSSRSKPAGYFMLTNSAAADHFEKQYKGQAMSELATLRRVMGAEKFLEFLGQIRAEFEAEVVSAR